ncbi:MAG: rRNA maturation RNase YbeY [Phycisphaeraceae bacterium]|nr:MAG: rRNA maturation RNase YbeY [Phycisphaeraceae bacterium]
MTMISTTTATTAAARTGGDADAPASEDPGPSRRSTQTPSSANANAPAPSCALIDATGRLAPATLDWLARHAERAMALLNTTGEIRARIVLDDEMARAHEQHCNAPGTTDVITFDLRDDPADRLDTDILLCLDEAQRQAALRNHPVERELLLYIIHAVLHCLGHDDHDDESFQIMHAREDEILAALGVGTTFSVEPTADPGAGSQSSR